MSKFEVLYNNNIIKPSPTVSISPEIYYANDEIIGYSYKVTLNGYATAMEISSVGSGTPDVVNRIDEIRNIFSENNRSLIIKQGSKEIINASGTTVRSLEFTSSEDRWYNYAPFSVELEFNEILINDCESSIVDDTVTCGTKTIFDNTKYRNKNTNLVDYNKYKIKNFTDKWSLIIDSDAYTNEFYRLSYTVTATGQKTTVPSYDNARLFCYNKLKEQVDALFNGVLRISTDGENTCTSITKTDELYEIDKQSTKTDIGFISGANTDGDTAASINLKIYNETLSNDISESDGTCSLTYTSIVKAFDPGADPAEQAVLVSSSITENTTYSDKVTTTTTTQGTITGLTIGSMIKNSLIYKINDKYVIEKIQANNSDKYANARAYFNSFITPLMANRSRTSSEHNYGEGTIQYSINDDTNTNSQQQQTQEASSITITYKDSVPITQEFIIPGRSNPLIQNLGMSSPAVLSINVEGRSNSNIQCITSQNQSSSLSICGSSSANIPPAVQNRIGQYLQSGNWYKSRHDYTTNPIDGSYSLSMEYTSYR